jgi:hypothetical protein
MRKLKGRFRLSEKPVRVRLEGAYRIRAAESFSTLASAPETVFLGIRQARPQPEPEDKALVAALLQHSRKAQD